MLIILQRNTMGYAGVQLILSQVVVFLWRLMMQKLLVREALIQLKEGVIDSNCEIDLVL